MTRSALVLAALCGGLATATATSRLITEQIGAYRKLLQEDKLTPDGLMKLARLHDSDSHCVGACVKHLEDMVGGTAGMEWDKLEELLNKIYGGQISSDPFQPQEVHLSLTGSLSEMKVMWATMDALQDPFVEFTAAAEGWDEATTLTNKATSFTYTVPQNWYPTFAGVLYETNMVGLAPGKVPYRYRVGGLDTVNNTIRRSKDFTFHSAPIASPNDKTVVAMVADQGTFMFLGFATSKKLIQLQDSLGVDLVMYAGDLCYAGLSGDLTPFNNIDEDDEFGHIWDLWGIQNEPIAATRPFMTGSGNHESFYNWTSYTNRYKMPAEASRGNGNFWFSYDYNNIHTIALSTEHCFDAGCDQMVWLENDLKAAVANRANVPWIVVAMHRPMYSSEASQTVPGNKFQVGLEAMMLEYDVDLVLQGHVHAYERVHPVNNGVVTVQPKKIRGENGPVDLYNSDGLGPVYVVQGNTGAMQFETWMNPQPEWSAKRFANGYIPPRDIHNAAGEEELKGLILKSNYTDTFGFGVASFANATHLHYSVIPITGTIGVDEFWIVKRV